MPSRLGEIKEAIAIPVLALHRWTTLRYHMILCLVHGLVVTVVPNLGAASSVLRRGRPLALAGMRSVGHCTFSVRRSHTLRYHTQTLCI